jgi:hypothetical protein
MKYLLRKIAAAGVVTAAALYGLILIAPLCLCLWLWLLAD